MANYVQTSNINASGANAFTLASSDSLEVITGVELSASTGYSAVFTTGDHVTVSVDGALFGSNAIYVFGSGGGNIISVGTQGIVTGMGNAITLNGSSGNDVITNNGQISSVQAAAISMGANGRLVNNGTISGYANALVSTGGNTITNHGTISSQVNNAIHETAGNNTLTNTGTIETNSLYYDGVYFLGANNLVNNSGAISGGEGVYFNTGAGFNTLNNSGTITGTVSVDMGAAGGIITNDGYLYGIVKMGASTTILNNNGSISGAINGTGTEIINNRGTIDGTVTFDAGNDTYNGLLGSVSGDVNGLAGNDTLIGGAEGERLFGGGGTDVLKGGGGDDVLGGSSGADLIKGGSGDDVLNGGASGDSLNGGDDSDVFKYTQVSDSTGAGYDTIVAFNTDEDTFNLSVPVSALDAAVATGQLRGGVDFDGDLAAAVGGGQLQAHHAVLFTADSGTHAGDTFLVVDANGVAGYQSGQDYVMQLVHTTNLSGLGVDNFS